MHWINFPLLAVIDLLGCPHLIGADSQHEGAECTPSLSRRVRWFGLSSGSFPHGSTTISNLKFQLGEWAGLSLLLHVVLRPERNKRMSCTLFFSGEWRELVPTRRSFREATQVILHDLGIEQAPSTPRRKIQMAHNRWPTTGVILMGAGLLLTGPRPSYKANPSYMYLPHCSAATRWARWFHFWLTVAYVGLFSLVHVAQVNSRRLEQIPRP